MATRRPPPLRAWSSSVPPWTSAIEAMIESPRPLPLSEPVSTFEDQKTALAWRDQLRSMGVDASCVADHPLDRSGRGDIYLIVPPEQWSRASEIVDDLE
jgi:hypothetical protein